jgi:hypothetical protein
LTLRDTKTALIIFVWNKNITSVIETIKQEIINHKNFKEFIGNDFERISCRMTLPDDDKIEIMLETIVFHFPELI